VRGFVALGLLFGLAPGGRARGSAARAGLLTGPYPGGADAVQLGGDAGERGVALGGVAFGFLGVVADDPPDAGVESIRTSLTRRLSRTCW
jgi:hypothetical protein